MILTLVNDLLDLAKIEQFKFVLHETHFDLAKMVRQSCQTMKPLSDVKGVKLHANFQIRLHMDQKLKDESEEMSQKSKHIAMDLKQDTGRASLYSGLTHMQNQNSSYYFSEESSEMDESMIVQPQVELTDAEILSLFS